MTTIDEQLTRIRALLDSHTYMPSRLHRSMVDAERAAGLARKRGERALGYAMETSDAERARELRQKAVGHQWEADLYMAVAAEFASRLPQQNKPAESCDQAV